MTTIKSAFEYSPRTLEVEKGRKYEGGTYLRIMNGMFAGEDIQIPTADLLAALDATANADVKHRADIYAQLSDAEAKLDEAKASIDNWRQEVGIVTRERDALAATVERVRALKWVGTYNAPYLKEKLAAALDPEPALPTEPGSVIFIDADVIQERDGIPAACQRDGRFRALDGSAGGWDRDTITAWRPAKVVAE